MILGRRALEMAQRAVVLAAVIEDVREVDARLGVLVVPSLRNMRRTDTEPVPSPDGTEAEGALAADVVAEASTT